MISRETVVQVGVVVVAICVFLVSLAVQQRFAGGPLVFAVVSTVFNVLVFAGGHFYLALRGEGGRVPIDARWRFVGAVVAVSTFGVLSRLSWASDVEVLPRLFGALGVLVAVGYLLYEAREGYRDSRATA